MGDPEIQGRFRKMKLAFEVGKGDAIDLVALAAEHPSLVKMSTAQGIDGAAWLTFVVDMTKVLAPHVFALLTILVTTGRKVIVIQDGKRKELTKEELERLQREQSDKAT